MTDAARRMAHRAARRVRWRERAFGALAPFLRRDPGAAERWASGGVVLLYHRVVADDAAGGDPFAVTRSAFEAQLDWLIPRFRLARVDDLVARCASGAGLAGWLAVSFDDGYEDTFRLAWPALKARGVAATLFVDTGRLDAGRPALTGAELRSLAGDGMEVGFHSVTHRDLTGLDDTSLDAELRRGRAALERASGGAVTGFAYPYGRYNRRVRSAVGAAGYAYACSCRQHATNHPGDDLLGLKRVEVNRSDDLGRFAAKVSGRYARLYGAWYRLSPGMHWWLSET